MVDSSWKIENENIRKFLATVEKDQELQKKFSQIRSPEEAYALAASIQGGFTKEEFVTEMRKMYENLTMDLTDEDIAQVAGGSGAELSLGLVVSMASYAAATGVAAI